MHRQVGSAAEIVAAIRHILAEQLGEDDALLIDIPEPYELHAGAADGEWDIARSHEPGAADDALNAAVDEARRAWRLASSIR